MSSPSAAMISRAPPLPGTGNGDAAVQSGTLTAGDYDDVLNPGLYAAYLKKTKAAESLGGSDLPYVDAENRISVKVLDRLGKPVPFAKVQLATPDGDPMFPLTTGATGEVFVYPKFDALEDGTRLEASVDGWRGTTKQSLSANMLETGGAVTLTLGTDRAPIKKMDVLLTMDATGSMSDEMVYLQAELDSIFRRIKSANPDVDLRAGLIVYRDEGDEYVTRDFAFTNDFDLFRKNLAAQQAYDGGDFPEAMDKALDVGLGFDWRSDAVKVNLLVADAPPHKEDITATWDSALMSRVEGIHMVPIAASGVDKTAEFMMRAMGQVTGGRYLFLTDDSGVGNPHAEPDVDCYTVTKLNGLVERVLQSLLTGVRVEPEGSDVIRTVGNYQAGICKISNQ